MPLNLFALTSDPARRVLKFSLSNEVQVELTAYFEAQEQSFNDYIEEEIEFDGKYKPDAGEVLVINGFDDIDGLENAIRNPLTIHQVEASPEVMGSIKAIFSGYVDEANNVVLLIQCFDKRKIISTNGLSIFHAADVFKKIEGIGLTLDTKLAATLIGNRLRFFSFHVMRQLFDMSEYYREATDSDINEFAQLECISVDDMPQLIAMADTAVRRKVSLIQQSQILERVAVADIRTVAMEFDIPLATVVSDGIEKIRLPTNKADLKKILRFLDEDYYKSPLSNTQFLSNSKRAV